MTIRMDKGEFDSLAIDTLGHACFAPMVPVYQAGMQERGEKEAAEYRREFCGTLSPGQRALFMFFTYYDHAIRSQGEFERISHHYLSAQIWSAVKKGIEYFRDDDMLRLLQNIEQSLSQSAQSDISELYRQLHEISPRTLAAIGTHIKENPTEFICFD